MPSFSRITHMYKPCDFRTRLIDHILWLKTKDPDYARQALKSYHEAMPWLDLMNGVRERLAA